MVEDNPSNLYPINKLRGIKGFVTSKTSISQVKKLCLFSWGGGTRIKKGNLLRGSKVLGEEGKW